MLISADIFDVPYTNLPCCNSTPKEIEAATLSEVELDHTRGSNGNESFVRVLCRHKKNIGESKMRCGGNPLKVQVE